MIFDSVENIDKYTSVHEDFKDAFALLKKLIAENAADGKYAISDDVYAKVSSYNTHPLEGTKAEYHEKFIDLQYVVDGKEQIVIPGNNSKLTETEPYCEGKDCGFASFSGYATSLQMTGGDFAILFPGEYHAPGCSCNGTGSPVRKIVVKIKV